jgi:RNA recognition motif-containing protein
MNIYVGNLSYNATEDDIRQAFGAFGEVTTVSIISDRETGRSRGFAFVEMADDNAAKTAIAEMNQKDLVGRAITVNEARPKTDRPRGPRPGGGGFGGPRGDGPPSM